MSSFQKEGFCSNEARKIIRPIKKRSRDWFDFAFELNRCLQKIVYRAGGIKDTLFSKKVVTTAIFLRSVTSFQGCLLLAERGMHISAYSLTRSIFEDSLCLSAIYQEWESFKLLFEDDYKSSRKKQMIYILQTQKLDPEMISKLNQQIKTMGKSRTLDMKAVSALGPMEKQYLFYQLISANASHCSADSLRSQISVSEDKSGWNGFKYGPSDQGAIDAVLWSACSAAIPTALAYCEILEDRESQRFLSELARQFRLMPSQELEMIRSFRENT